jgi:hypothetical protein
VTSEEGNCDAHTPVASCRFYPGNGSSHFISRGCNFGAIELTCESGCGCAHSLWFLKSFGYTNTIVSHDINAEILPRGAHSLGSANTRVVPYKFKRKERQGGVHICAHEPAQRPDRLCKIWRHKREHKWTEVTLALART